MKLSLCIITLNEEKNLGRCLQSAKTLVDEIIIVDSGAQTILRQSPETTTQIGLSENGPGMWNKEFCHWASIYDWILSLDADEVFPTVDPEIIQWKQRHTVVLWIWFSRCVFYEGRWIRHGDWYPDRLVRLFARGAGNEEGESMSDWNCGEGCWPKGELLSRAKRTIRQEIENMRNYGRSQNLSKEQSNGLEKESSGRYLGLSEDIY